VIYRPIHLLLTFYFFTFLYVLWALIKSLKDDSNDLLLSLHTHTHTHTHTRARARAYWVNAKVHA